MSALDTGWVFDLVVGIPLIAAFVIAGIVIANRTGEEKV